MRPRSWMLLSATVLTALVLATPGAAPLGAQSGETAALRVRVTDAVTGRPIEGAQVGFPELGLFKLAAASGIAQIVEIPPGMHALEVTMLGYGKASKVLNLEAHAMAAGDIALEADPIEIEGLTVTASSQIKYLRDMGFYNRDRMGHGYQLGPLELAAINAVRPSDYFVKIPTVELVSYNTGNQRKEVVSRRSCTTLSTSGISGAQTGLRTPPVGGFATAVGANGATGPFIPPPSPGTMAKYLDGAPYYGELDLLPTEMIQAIEVYVGAEVPMQFNFVDRGECGVVLIWSKR